MIVDRSRWPAVVLCDIEFESGERLRKGSTVTVWCVTDGGGVGIEWPMVDSRWGGLHASAIELSQVHPAALAP